MKSIILALLLVANLAYADARQINEYRWEGVSRIVAIGDIHGDYDNYIATLRAAGLVNKKGKWSAGDTHLVQTGDIPDRGPDTLKIIEHIGKLAKQAKKKGGRVHSLIGNHEAMNLYGDLRYVSEGEFEAFVTSKSAALRDRFFELSMQDLEAQDPERFAALPENYREEWNRKIPLGWVEHRQAWDPYWNAKAPYAKWVLENKVAIQINDNIFLHGGISAYYCQNSLEWITEQTLAVLGNFSPGTPSLVEDENGPLWYRGLSGVEPEAPLETVEAILAQHDARHIVVGHTVTSGVIWPRYDARVVMIDTGISKAYGGYVAYLEITPEGLYAGYPDGKLPLPDKQEGLVPYLEKVISMDPENRYLKKRLLQLQNPGVPVQEGTPEAATDEYGAETDEQPVPICGISGQ